MNNTVIPNFIGIFVSIFLALLLFTKKGKNRSDDILGIWLLTIGFHLWLYYMILSDGIYQFPILLGSHLIFPFLHGPLLVFYIISLTKPHQFTKKMVTLHAILPIVVCLIYFPFFSMTADEKIRVFQNQGQGFEHIISVVNILLSLSGLFYLFYNFKLVNDHKRNIMAQFSNQEKINLNWLRILVYMMAFIWILIIIVQSDFLIFSTTTVYLICIGYFGIKQGGIFSNTSTNIIANIPIQDPNSNIIPEQIKKYAKSGLNEETAVEIHEKLNQVMIDEKLFKESELTLDELSKALDVQPNYISQVINEREGVNFYDYVNKLRVEEFKRISVLPENQNFTLISLAYECGFNSKSAFNRIFKKMTDLSPSEYTKSQLPTK